MAADDEVPIPHLDPLPDDDSIADGEAGAHYQGKASRTTMHKSKSAPAVNRFPQQKKVKKLPFSKSFRSKPSNDHQVPIRDWSAEPVDHALAGKRCRVKTAFHPDPDLHRRAMALVLEDNLTVSEVYADGWAKGVFGIGKERPEGVFPIDFVEPVDRKYARPAYAAFVLGTDVQDRDESGLATNAVYRYDFAMRMDLMEHTSPKSRAFARVRHKMKKVEDPFTLLETAEEPVHSVRLMHERIVSFVVAEAHEINSLGSARRIGSKPRVVLDGCLGVFAASMNGVDREGVYEYLLGCGSKRLIKLKNLKFEIRDGDGLFGSAAFDRDVDRKIFEHPSANGARKDILLVVDLKLTGLATPIRVWRIMTVKVYEAASGFQSPGKLFVPALDSTYKCLVATTPSVHVACLRLCIFKKAIEGIFQCAALTPL